jgi:hypothetical protein
VTDLGQSGEVGKESGESKGHRVVRQQLPPVVVVVVLLVFGRLRSGSVLLFLFDRRRPVAHSSGPPTDLSNASVGMNGMRCVRSMLRAGEGGNGRYQVERVLAGGGRPAIDQQALQGEGHGTHHRQVLCARRSR